MLFWCQVSGENITKTQKILNLQLLLYTRNKGTEEKEVFNDKTSLLFLKVKTSSGNSDEIKVHRSIIMIEEYILP